MFEDYKSMTIMKKKTFSKEKYHIYIKVVIKPLWSWGVPYD